jgi:hypothetical protein
MRKNEAFPSKYFKAADLDDGPLTLTISQVDYDELTDPNGRKQKKPVIRFRKVDKRLVCNATNFDNIAEATKQPDSDDWVGHTIELYPSEAQIGSKMVPCIRVRVPEETPTRRPAKKAKKPTDDDLDDEIPFN